MFKKIYLFFIILFVYSCNKSTKSAHFDTVNIVVDSVWVKKPGEINTMQVDYIYFARFKNGKTVSSRNSIRAGDTLKFIYNDGNTKKISND
jgi:hypothetical protein